MSYHYSATGERIEDEDLQSPEVSPPATVTGLDRDPVIVARCNDLRRILAESRARRQAVA